MKYRLPLVGVISKRIVIWRAKLQVPNLTLLPYLLRRKTNTLNKMSLIDLRTLTNGDLKKRLTRQINVEDWTDRCSKCGYPKLIHENLQLH